jgi:lipopolysaccharide transport system ATP-binding protein
VDEALSVGDTYFQHKSFDRIRTFRKEGTTLLIVSHDRYAIQTVCDRAILLDAGHVKMEGSPTDVLDYYHAMMAEKDHLKIRQLALADGRVATISGTGEVYITDVQLLDKDNQPINSVKVGQELNLVVSIKARMDLSRVVLGFMITDRLGHCIYGINTHRLQQPIEDMMAGEEATFRFRFPARLGKGSYSLSLSLSRFDSHLDKNYEWRDNAMMFHVFNTKQEDFVGSSWLDAKVDVVRHAHQS